MGRVAIVPPSISLALKRILFPVGNACASGGGRSPDVLFVWVSNDGIICLSEQGSHDSCSVRPVPDLYISLYRSVAPVSPWQVEIGRVAGKVLTGSRDGDGCSVVE